MHNIENTWEKTFDDDSSTEPIMSSMNEYDKLFIPVTIKTMKENILDGTDVIKYGTYTFVQVCIICQIESVTFEEDGSKMKYIVCDPKVDSITKTESFPVVQYLGFGIEAVPYAVGTIVTVVGKIRFFEGELYVAAHKILVLDSMEKYNVFPKESRYVELYFKKDIPQRCIDNSMDVFVNTMLSRKPPQSNYIGRNSIASQTAKIEISNKNVLSDKLVNGSGAQNLYDFSGLDDDHLNNEQQNKIIEYFKTHPISYDKGHAKSVIREAINGTDAFDEDLNLLEQSGRVFSTFDNDHFALVA